MGDHRNREHYIPLLKHDLLALLCADNSLAEAERDQLHQFGRLLTATLHYEYNQRLEELKAAVPDAHVDLHLREFVWRRDPGVPRISQLTAVVTRKIGAVLLRREYIVSDEDVDANRTRAEGEGVSMKPR